MKSVLKIAFCVLLLGCLANANMTAQTWDYVDSGSDYILFDMSIPEPSSGKAYAVGMMFTVDSDSHIIKTTDGGDNWEVIFPTSGTVEGLEILEFASPDHGYAAGYDSIYETTDGGTTWNAISVGSDIYRYLNVIFYDDQIGFINAQANGGNLLSFVTTDGGATWVEQASTTNMAGFSACFADANTIYTVGANQVISKSTDQGATWEVVYTGIPTFYLLEAHFLDANNGVVSGEDGELLVTTDGGSSWSSYATGYHNFYGLAYLESEIWAAGTDQDVFISNDGGTNWDFVHDGDPIATFYDIEFFDSGQALICGSQGTVLRYTPVLGIGDNQSNADVLVSYNPHTELVNIRSNDGEIMSIRAVDAAGRQVFAKEVKGQTLQLSAASWSSGMYVIQLTTSKGVSTRKIIK